MPQQQSLFGKHAPTPPSTAALSRRSWRTRLLLAVALSSAVVPRATMAQSAAPSLAPKRTLTTGPAPGCEIPLAGQAPAVRRDNVEARRLSTAGQEAALIGDQAAARDAFVRAAVLNPGDERIAYDLARAHEALIDSTRAISEFCRYLTLSPAGREAADVRDRLVRLVPPAAQRRAADVEVAFRLGLALFDDGRYDAAVDAFSDVVRDTPKASEGYFNRALARAARGARGDALQDLEQYRALAPTVDDRVEVGRAIEVLRRPVYGRGMAFARSVVPGFGQFYTGHPVRGVLVLAAVGGAAGFAFTQQTTTANVPYVDPNGVPAPYTVTTQERAYFTAGLGVAAAVTVIGMIDAVVAANSSRRGANILARGGRTAWSPGAPRDATATVAIAPLLDRQRRAGLSVSVRF